VVIKLNSIIHFYKNSKAITLFLFLLNLIIYAVFGIFPWQMNSKLFLDFKKISLNGNQKFGLVE